MKLATGGKQECQIFSVTFIWQKIAELLKKERKNKHRFRLLQVLEIFWHMFG